MSDDYTNADDMSDMSDLGDLDDLDPMEYDPEAWYSVAELREIASHQQTCRYLAEEDAMQLQRRLNRMKRRLRQQREKIKELVELAAGHAVRMAAAHRSVN